MSIIQRTMLKEAFKAIDKLQHMLGLRYDRIIGECMAPRPPSPRWKEREGEGNLEHLWLGFDMRFIWFRFKRVYYLYLLKRRKLPSIIRNHLQACLRLDLRKTVSETDFVVFDTETTGLHAKKGDRIVSVSAVRLRQGRIDLSDTFHEIVNPNRDIPSKTAVIHGILPRMVDGKPTLEEILPDFIEYIGSSILVATMSGST